VQKEAQFGTANARIRVEKNDIEGLDHPYVCQLCEDLPCVESCPTDALLWDEAAGRILLVPEDCINCVICVDVCPFDAIWMQPDTMLPILCDLCAGDPACVNRCATGAIVLLDEIVDVGEEK
jgi:Fe-S-cluster-containing hydrogenase component 2